MKLQLWGRFNVAVEIYSGWNQNPKLQSCKLFHEKGTDAHTVKFVCSTVLTISKYVDLSHTSCAVLTGRFWKSYVIVQDK